MTIREEIVMGENGTWIVLYRCRNCGTTIEKQK